MALGHLSGLVHPQRHTRIDELARLMAQWSASQQLAGIYHERACLDD